MIRAFFAFLLLWVLLVFPFLSQYAFAASVDLRGVQVVTFAETIFKHTLGVDYVLTQSALNAEEKITVNIRSVPDDRLVSVVGVVLDLHGYRLINEKGIYIVDKKAPDITADSNKSQFIKEDNVVAHGPISVYWPVNRPGSFLRKAVQFAGGRVVQGQGNDSDDKIVSTNDPVIYSEESNSAGRVAGLLAKIDLPLESVSVKAALVEVTDASDSGRSLKAMFSLLSGKVGVSISLGSTLANALTIKGTDISAVLSLMDSKSQYKYLAQPMIKVLDGSTGVLSVGSDVPVRGAVSTDKNGNTLQSIEYRSSGVKLSVTPSILGDLIYMNIAQEVSNFGVTTTSNIDSPTLYKRSIASRVDLADGDILVLSGMDETKATDSSSGFFFLPEWFASRSNKNDKSQILLLLEVRKAGFSGPGGLLTAPAGGSPPG